MVTEQAFLNSFMTKYLNYCRDHKINISAVCRSLESQGLNCYPQKLYNIKNGYYNRPTSIYTLIALCNEVNLTMQDVLALDDHK